MPNIFAVYKPKGPTSFDVVKKVRALTGAKKVGHAGTLDPLAEGVLVIAVGDATKRIHEVVAKEKEYEATVRLGVVSRTDDEEGEKEDIAAAKIPSEKDIADILKKFTGKISQVPPAYSAIKVKGKAAYRYARGGKPLSLAAREVFIKSILLVRYEWPFLELKITTGPGAYIRALARDIGEALGTGGYMAALKRTRVGEFTATHAVGYNELQRFLEKSDKKF